MGQRDNLLLPHCIGGVESTACPFCCSTTFAVMADPRSSQRMHVVAGWNEAADLFEDIVVPGITS